MPRAKAFDEQEVLEKAMNLFWQKGYANTSMQDLVETLGINRASLYDTFGDKQQLFDRSLLLYRSTNREHVVAFFKARPNVKAGFRALFLQAIDEPAKIEARKGCFMVNTSAALTPMDISVHKEVEANKIFFEGLFKDYLDKGIADGQLSGSIDTTVISTLFFTQYNGIKAIEKINPDSALLIASVDVMLTLLDR